MSLPRSPRLRTGGFLLAAAIVLCLIIAAPLLFQIPAALSLTENDAQISFSADRQTVAFPGNCLAVSWQVENIDAIFLNDQPVVGAGQEEVCIEPDSMPTLGITFRNGAARDYRLNITILSALPLTWLGALVALALLAAAVYNLLYPVWAAFGAGIRGIPALRQIGRGAAASAFGLLVAALLLEIILRVYFGSVGTQQDRIKYLLSEAEIRSLGANVIALPYVGYIPSPYLEGHNALGYRGAEVEIPKPETTFRIVTLGGSTTYSTGTTAEESYSAQLQNLLRDQYGYGQVEVVNGGVSGYTTWEILASMAFRVLELEPDMILFYEGVNDVVVRENSSLDCYRGYNAMRGLNPNRGLWVTRQQPLSPSVLYRVVAVNLGWMENPLNLDSRFEPPDVRCKQDNLDVTLAQRMTENAPVYFRRNLHNIIALAQANDIQPVLSTWTYYQSAARPDEWRTAVEEHNAIIRDEAAALGVPLHDLAASFPLDAALWETDGIHMIAAGAAEQARQYAAFLDERGLLPSN